MGLHGRFYRLIAGRPAGPILAAGKGFGSGREPKFPPLQDRNQDSRAGLFPQPTALGEHRLRPTRKQEVLDMLGWVVTFLIIALIAGILGFGGIAGASIEIAKIIFFIAVVLFLVSAVIGVSRGRTRV
jgi:uncharacterized membrane protein YtjA (UPF0391 family)